MANSICPPSRPLNGSSVLGVYLFQTVQLGCFAGFQLYDSVYDVGMLLWDWEEEDDERNSEDSWYEIIPSNTTLIGWSWSDVVSPPSRDMVVASIGTEFWDRAYICYAPLPNIPTKTRLWRRQHKTWTLYNGISDAQAHWQGAYALVQTTNAGQLGFARTSPSSTYL